MGFSYDVRKFGSSCVTKIQILVKISPEHDENSKQGFRQQMNSYFECQRGKVSIFPQKKFRKPWSLVDRSSMGDVAEQV